MIRVVASRSLRNWGTAVLAVVAGLLVNPRASQAGCGDYVLVGGRLGLMDHSLPDQATSIDGSSADAGNHGTPQRPCHGPGCSDGSFPPLAPVPTIVVPVDRWAMAPSDALPNFVCCDNILAEPLDFVADGFSLSILRPPR